jgi:hypothetical protein
MLASALLAGGAPGSEAGDLLRPVVRCAGLLVTAWGLTRREKWAWWIGVVLPAFWVIAGSAALLAYARLAPDVLQLPGVDVQAGIGIAFLVLLAAAVVLLLTPSARRACRIG